MLGGARKTIRRALGRGKKRAGRAGSKSGRDDYAKGGAKRSSTRKTRGRKTRGRKTRGRKSSGGLATGLRLGRGHGSVMNA
jgi:hypothetical protein